MNDTQCLVVDSSYMARSVITSQRAFTIVYKGNAEILTEYPTFFRTVKGLEFAKPSIIRVFKYIKLEYNKVPLTRTNIYKRDDYTCVYCGKASKSDLTLDHVIPRSRGGKDSWDNLVTACRSCNGEKGDLDVLEWAKENPNPRRPHFLMLVKNMKHIPKDWEPYLFT